MLPVLPAVCAHPYPRRRASAREMEWERFRCLSPLPKLEREGGYRADRTPRLQRHLRQAVARGLEPSVLDASKPGLNASLLYTHEAAAWPKPARCQVRRQEVCKQNPHFCLALPYGNAPRRALVSDKWKFEFRIVWKVASSSLASFFFCNMWGDIRSEKLLPGLPPREGLGAAEGTALRKAVTVDGAAPGEEAGRRKLVAFASREPIGRFVASVFEVLERLLNRVTPSGAKMDDAMYVEPSGPMSSTVLSRSTSWYAPLRALLTNRSSGADVRSVRDARDAAVYDLLSGFIADAECGLVYSASEHMATQMSFITAGLQARAQLDVQLRLQNISADLERLRAALGYTAANASEWKCALGRENDGSAKQRLPLTKEEVLATLRRHPSLVQRLCTVYFQDFACLGFALPPECEGGKELAWLGTPEHRGPVAEKRHRHALAEEAVTLLDPPRRKPRDTLLTARAA